MVAASIGQLMVAASIGQLMVAVSSGQLMVAASIGQLMVAASSRVFNGVSGVDVHSLCDIVLTYLFNVFKINSNRLMIGGAFSIACIV